MTDQKREFEVLPEGDYQLRLEELIEKPLDNAKATGKMLVGKFEVMKGDFKKKAVWRNFIVEYTKKDGTTYESGKSPVDIALSNFDKYLRAVGETGGLEAIGNDISNLDDYMGLPFVGTVTQKTYEFKGETRTSNELKKFSAI